MELQCVVLYTVVEKPTPPEGAGGGGNSRKHNGVGGSSPHNDTRRLLSVPSRSHEAIASGCLDWIKSQIKRFLFLTCVSLFDNYCFCPI